MAHSHLFLIPVLFLLFALASSRVHLSFNRKHSRLAYYLEYEIIKEKIVFHLTTQESRGQLEIRYGEALSLLDCISVVWDEQHASVLDKHRNSVFASKSQVDQQQDVQLVANQYNSLNKEYYFSFERQLDTQDKLQDVKVVPATQVLF